VTAQRRHVVYLAWSVNRGRVVELGSLLDAHPRLFYPPRLAGRRLKAVRYLVSVLWTAYVVLRERPTVVLVVNPPVLAAASVVALARLSGAAVLLDSHPGGFGAQGDRLSARLQPLHRWAVRRCRATLVTGEHWAEVVTCWGGRPLVVHEPPAPWTAVEGPGPGTGPVGRAQVLFLGTYGRDEPVAELVEAARLLPEVEVRITGDPGAAPPGLLDQLPPNVRLLGYLGPEQYQAEVLRADLAVVLTTEPTSVMRAGYEAVYARRPLLVSDWPGLRIVFPHAVHVPNTAQGIADGVRRAVHDLERLRGLAAPAREEQEQRWRAQLADLRAVIG
jgi:glycosyltransferase involved in cell wall biosynthesis